MTVDPACTASHRVSAVAVPAGDGAGGLHRVVVPRRPGRRSARRATAACARAASTSPLVKTTASSPIAGVRSPEPSSTGVSAAQSTATAARAASAASIDSPSTIATGQPSYGIRSSVNGSVNTAAGDVEPGEVGQVGRGEHGRDPGQGAGRGGVDPAQGAGGDGRADEHGVQHPSGRWSAANARGPGELGGGLDCGWRSPGTAREREGADRGVAGHGHLEPVVRQRVGVGHALLDGGQQRLPGERHADQVGQRATACPPPSPAPPARGRRPTTAAAETIAYS